MFRKLSFTKKIYLAMAMIFGLLLLVAGTAYQSSSLSRYVLTTAVQNSTGAAALAEAQSALWELRWGFPQFMVTDETGRKKVLDSDPKLRKLVEDRFNTYEKTDPSPDERKALAELRTSFAKYVEARPKWFELYGAGKLDEAKEWRAATTTPFGAATVKGFTDLINLQATSANKEFSEDDFKSANLTN